jgi:hypothetical protein
MSTILNLSSLLNYNQAALELNLTPESVRRLVSQGRLGHLKIGGRVFFRPSHLVEFAKEIPASPKALAAKPAAAKRSRAKK